MPVEIHGAQKLKKLLDRYGYSDVWLTRGVGNNIAFNKNFRQRVKNCHIQEWNNTIFNSSKLSLFRILKCTKYSKYLPYFKGKSFRSIIMTSRCCNHQLAI